MKLKLLKNEKNSFNLINIGQLHDAGPNLLLPGRKPSTRLLNVI